MESFIKLQIDTKNSIEKGRTNYKKSPKDRLTQSYLETRLESLERQWKSFLEYHKKIIEIATDSSHNYFKTEMFDTTEEFYINYKSELKEHISQVKNINQVSEKMQITKIYNNVKLPKVTIPTFSGKYTEWTSFRDMFLSLIHKNDTIDDVQKLHYLKGHLSGEAEHLLRHTPVTAANYQECWQMLNKRYDNKRYLCNSILTRLINQPNVSVSSTAIKELLDSTVDCLHGLSTLGIDTDSWDAIVIYIISAKLDSESRKLWESKISTNEELPTFDEFKIFLESRFRSLEYLDTPTTSKQKSTVTKPKVLHAVSSKNYTSVNISCPLCKQPHKLSHCKQFGKEDYQTRSEFVRTHGLCYNCLGANHSIKFCRVTTSCQVCNRKHHSLLHPKGFSSSASPQGLSGEASAIKAAVSTLSAASDSVQESDVINVTTHFSKRAVPNQVLLATALVEAQTKNGANHLLRVLLDQGSQASFITESAVQLLGLKKLPARGVISGIGGDESAVASKFIVFVNIKSRHDPNFIYQVRAFVLGTITTLIPGEKISVPTWPELDSLTLADPEYHTPNKIDVLLGAEVYGQVLREGLIKHSPGSLIAQNTCLGWILSGATRTLDFESNSAHCHQVFISMHSQISDNEMLKRFWEIESDARYGKERILTQEEQLCEEFYNRTTQRDSTGRYVVKLPFKDADPPCKYGHTREIALKRFQLLERRFKKDPEIKKKYTDVIQEYLDLGHMEEIPPENDKERAEAVYLPHHAVVREDKATTKVRVVFDASCKGVNGVSLNDSLMVGPTIQPDLRHLVMRWRLHPIVLCADIVKMYRQVIVAPENRNFQRLLWRCDPESEIKDYKLLRVTFGTACAPYLAVKTLQQLAHDEGDEFPLVSEKLKEDYYVDDFMSGCQTVEEGIRIYKEMKGLVAKGGFELQKWMTNNKDLSREIKEDRSIQKVESVEIKMDEVMKILGISWDRELDSFKYTVTFPPQPGSVTKRKVISEIARLFDPLGWVAPCVITAKILIQKLWLAGIDWDDSLPEELLKEWKNYQADLLHLPQIVIPRWVETRSKAVMELQGFCDASNKAYAAVVYLRVIEEDCDVKVHLVTAKTKVAPTKQLSIPRLELMGAVILAKLITEVAETLGIERENIHCWTDSTIVLAWLSGHPSRWTTFVGNRVSEILTLLENTQWAHVRSACNPADIASRGVTPSELSQSSLWFHGPSWLTNKTINYTKPKLITTELEKRLVKAHVTTCQDDKLWTKFSSIQKLVRVVAYCRRFLTSNKKRTTYLTSEEIAKALEICIKKFQQQAYSEEIEDIKKKGSVSKKSKLKALCPTIDSEGILRVGGRIENAQISENMRHPIIIPQQSHLAWLLVDEAHKKTLHGGPTLLLSYLRTKYWIISAKNLVKLYVRKCVVCIRHSANFKNQFMGQLPTCRVTPARAFLHSGVDFAGPINIRVSKGRGNRSYKGYICLFVCMVTKAVHLEAISDLTSQAFIAGYKRFVARRGHCSDIWSDNGKNFVGASRELKCLFIAEQSSVASEIRDWFSSSSVNWHFIPPHAPNFGGLWEAGIKSTKFHLKRIIGESTLTYEEMSTLLAQIEACLNSRPISQTSQNPNDPIPLTPGHFLIGEPLVLVPDRNYERSNIGTLKRWQYLQRLTQDFWRRWSQEYLTSMVHRYKWSQREPEPKIGDIALVKEDNLPPGKWLLGKILMKHPGTDGITRVVTLKCKDSVIKRPTCKLCILPVTD